MLINKLFVILSFPMVKSWGPRNPVVSASVHLSRCRWKGLSQNNIKMSRGILYDSYFGRTYQVQDGSNIFYQQFWLLLGSAINITLWNNWIEDGRKGFHEHLLFFYNFLLFFGLNFRMWYYMPKTWFKHVFTHILTDLSKTILKLSSLQIGKNI